MIVVNLLCVNVLRCDTLQSTAVSFGAAEWMWIVILIYFSFPFSTLHDRMVRPLIPSILRSSRGTNYDCWHDYSLDICACLSLLLLVVKNWEQ